MKNNQQNHIEVFLYLIQVKAVLSPLYQLRTSYWFLCSPLFVIACGSYAWSATPIREKTGVWKLILAMYKEARGISVP